MPSSTFQFAKTDQARRFCLRVRDALMTFCGKSSDESTRLILDYWADRDDIEDDELLYHEPPYYYAMCIAHHSTIGDDDPEWYQRPDLWPPPTGWALE